MGCLVPGLPAKPCGPRPGRTQKDRVREVSGAGSMCPIPGMGEKKPRAIKRWASPERSYWLEAFFLVPSAHSLPKTHEGGTDREQEAFACGEILQESLFFSGFASSLLTATPVFKIESLEALGELMPGRGVGAPGNWVTVDSQVLDRRAHRGKEQGQGRGSASCCSRHYRRRACGPLPWHYSHLVAGEIKAQRGQ